jgi:hypothetical protein
MNGTSIRRFGLLGLALAALTFAACGDDGGGRATGGNPCLSEEQAKNDQIRAGLEASCKGCHAEGPRGYFASLQAFEDLLAYNPAVVTPGDPDGSRLVQLLEGSAKGAYAQMPISGSTYSKLVDEGKATLTMAAIRSWIQELTPRPRVETPDRNAISVRRMSAPQVVSALYAQLGLTQEDFFVEGFSYGVSSAAQKSPDDFPVLDPDGIPGPYGGEADPMRRFFALGGGASSRGRRADLTASPSFVQALVPLSQRWCKMAIAKPSAQARLFPSVTPSTKSADDAAGIKSNIGHLHRHFLSEKPSAADIDDVFTNVFLPLEAETDPQTAWAGVCSYFIRHPRWVFF